MFEGEGIDGMVRSMVLEMVSVLVLITNYRFDIPTVIVWVGE